MEVPDNKSLYGKGQSEFEAASKSAGESTKGSALEV